MTTSFFSKSTQKISFPQQCYIRMPCSSVKLTVQLGVNLTRSHSVAVPHHLTYHELIKLVSETFLIPTATVTLLYCERGGTDQVR